MRRTAPCSRSKLLPSHDFNLFILILVSIVDHTSLCDFSIIVISKQSFSLFLLEIIEPRAKTRRSAQFPRLQLLVGVLQSYRWFG